MDLAIVVVNWNTREFLARCLCSIQAALLADAPFPGQIVIVDSASNDASAEMVRRDFPTVSLLELAENRGFGAAANMGIRSLSPSPHLPISPSFPSPLAGDGGTGGRGDGETPRYILLLNADTEIVGHAIQELVTYLETHPRVGVVGPQLRYPDGQVQSSRRRFPTPGTLFWESTVLEQYFPGNPWARRYHVADRPDDAPSALKSLTRADAAPGDRGAGDGRVANGAAQEVDWLVGACLLVRAEAISQAGLLDEGYFLYFEELEWCRRIRQAGWRVVYLPTARVLHHEGRSSEQVPLQRHLHFGRSKVRYAREVFGPRWAGLLRGFLLVTFAWQWLIEAGKWLLGHRRGLRRERMRIYAAVLKDGLKSEE